MSDNHPTRQLAARKPQQLAAMRVEKAAQVQFLLAASDWGVSRNGGRPGARFAPQAILHCLEKMARHPHSPSWQADSVWERHWEKLDFATAQSRSQAEIAKRPKSSKARHHIHLGGGHDHIYPLLKALEHSGAKKLVVFNIDAHCDTRPESLPHSGTPFRQFDRECTIPFELIQLGIHPYANTPETLAPLGRGKMTIYQCHELPQDLEKLLTRHLCQDRETHYLISLDCDALDAAVMEGVSAVNHQGMSLGQVQSIFDFAREHLNPVSYGIYEYNPVYDNLSQKGARALAALLYRNFFT